ncbi:MAG: type II toxin-antitoxin system RelE/ParE family toxin [Bacteroidota bacterium]
MKKDAQAASLHPGTSTCFWPRHARGARGSPDASHRADSRSTPRSLNLWDYIAARSVAGADKRIREIDKAFELLAENPGLGRARPELATGLRSFPVGRHVVFYQPLDDGIDVQRVLHEAQDVDRAFNPGDEDA